MRKSLILIAIFLALSIGILVSAAVNMDACHDDITITEQTLFGDPSAVSGLSVSTRVHHENRLFWDTTYMACADPQPETVFTYSDARIYEQGESSGTFSLDMSGLNAGISGNVDLDMDLEELETGDPGFLWLMVKDVADRTKPGEERTEQVYLRDYYETFPLSWYFHPRRGVEYVENNIELNQYFNKAFPIRVPEDLRLNVTVCKNEEGGIYRIDYNDYFEEEQDTYRLYHSWSPSAVTEEGVFFGMFGNMDFSQFPDGYGLYYIPVDVYDGHTVVDGRTGKAVDTVCMSQRAKNIYPMDPADCTDGSMYLSADMKQVYAFTIEGGETVLTVFDSRTCEIIQQLKPGIDRLPTVWCQDNVMVLVTGDEAWENFSLQVYLLENGKLNLWLNTELFLDESFNPMWYTQWELAFDGSRLAIVQYHDNWNVATHRIQVYDQSGLQYAGDFHHSGDDLPEHLITWENGLQIHWQ